MEDSAEALKMIGENYAHTLSSLSLAIAGVPDDSERFLPFSMRTLLQKCSQLTSLDLSRCKLIC